ncbi:secreted protein [Monoraphidium neglectum]|uniref:Secreted protein n=1 Tax=Monoraphidium neglectum TaxID=145388 RepID=A0A0D2MSX2_9CHLO|nr:secreted protein [Monoraphidium neglectum]KIZ03532.1 secreted protein [Monoraphidium neglectum]|eukprot:XP_013902551.1 secreted protein [Monoraphidium neglectum]
MWIVTGNPQYANNTASILWAWSTINKIFVGQNAPLEAGWGVDSMTRSAELLKYTWPGWTKELETTYIKWVNKLIMPQLRNEILSRLPLGNWHSTVAECKMQFAIFTDDRPLFEEALYDWRRVMDAWLFPHGEFWETKRDIYHSQFGLGGLVQLAELAWQQGVDVYDYSDSKLRIGMEYHADIIMGGVPFSSNWYKIIGNGFLPCGWEVGYNHFNGRRGLQLPITAGMLNRKRPEKYVFHWGLGTLTHFQAARALINGFFPAGGGDGRRPEAPQVYVPRYSQEGWDDDDGSHSDGPPPAVPASVANATNATAGRDAANASAASARAAGAAGGAGPEKTAALHGTASINATIGAAKAGTAAIKGALKAGAAAAWLLAAPVKAGQHPAGPTDQQVSLLVSIKAG